MKHIRVTVLAVMVLAAGAMGCLSSLPALAESGLSTQSSGWPGWDRTDGKVPHVSGGFGADEREEMLQRLNGLYNLQLVFAGLDGKFLSGVHVVIEGTGGGRLVDTVSDGPWLFTKLPAGRYRVTATVDGESIQKNAVVGETGKQSLHFHWRK